MYIYILIDRRLTDSRSLVDECIFPKFDALGFARLALPFGAARRSRGPSDGGTQNYPQLFMVIVNPGLIEWANALVPPTPFQGWRKKYSHSRSPANA